MDRTDSPEINPSIYCQMNFKECQGHSMWKGQAFQPMVLKKLDIHMQENEVEPLSYIIYKS